MTAGAAPGRITQLLTEIKQGNREAEESLIPLVYDELRRLARRSLRRERANHTLQTTALVNEAFLRLSGSVESGIVDRGHFFAIAGTLMRRILVDYARARSSEKRGGDSVIVALDENINPAGEHSWDTVLAVNQALERLAAINERQARVVELRFFSGLDVDEIAELLQVSSRTVKRDWQFAQAWMYAEMHPGIDNEKKMSPNSSKER